jgi:hypothetical protein
MDNLKNCNIENTDVFIQLILNDELNKEFIKLIDKWERNLKISNINILTISI